MRGELMLSSMLMFIGLLLMELRSGLYLIFFINCTNNRRLNLQCKFIIVLKFGDAFYLILIIGSFVLAQLIIFINNQNIMQVDKRQSKIKYTYVTDSRIKQCLPCSNCRSWEQKTQDLIWGYEELLSVKEKQIETMSQMVNQLDQKLKKANSKIETLTKRLHAYEQQIDKIRGSSGSNENVITYYRERENELLSQLKTVQNQLFSKNVQIKDEIDCKEDRALNDILTSDHKQSHHKLMSNAKSEASIIPIIHTSQTLGKMLQRNLCDLEKMSQQKMMLQVKHRMAVLRAAELSVLK